jgi:hypothetical protein
MSEREPMRSATNDERRTTNVVREGGPGNSSLCRFLENPAADENREFRASLRELLENDAEGAGWLHAARQVGEHRPKSRVLAWWVCSEARFVPLAAAALVGLYLACFLSPGVNAPHQEADTAVVRVTPAAASQTDIMGYQR